MTARLTSVALSLLWTRLLLKEMGLALNGLFLSFLAIAALGGLGDLGLGGAIALRAGRLLGNGQKDELLRFLATARGVFLMLAGAVALVLACLSPVLPSLLRFSTVEGSGPLWILFLLAAPAAALLILQSYIANLNYAALNLTWPVLPPVLLIQLATLSHWMLARHDCPLWQQYLPYMFSAAGIVLLYWYFLHLADRQLARLWPVRWDSALVRTLLGQSWWVYLTALGNFIYTSTDRLIINAVFGSAHVPPYQFNYKACELAVFAIITASFVTMPKIAQWLGSEDPVQRERAAIEAQRINRFQSLLGCIAGMVYLALNDSFILLWLGEALQVPTTWQAAFAANLAATLGTSVALDLATRMDEAGLRSAGRWVALAASFNLLLSLFAAVVFRSVVGVAIATVIAQAGLAIGLGYYVCQRLNLSVAEWLKVSVFWPLVGIGLSSVLRLCVPPDSARNIVLLASGNVMLAIALVNLFGFRAADLQREWVIVRGIFQRRN